MEITNEDMERLSQLDRIEMLSYASLNRQTYLEGLGITSSSFILGILALLFGYIFEVTTPSYSTADRMCVTAFLVYGIFLGLIGIATCVKTLLVRKLNFKQLEEKYFKVIPNKK